MFGPTVNAVLDGRVQGVVVHARKWISTELNPLSTELNPLSAELNPLLLFSKISFRLLSEVEAKTMYNKRLQLDLI